MSNISSYTNWIKFSSKNGIYYFHQWQFLKNINGYKNDKWIKMHNKKTSNFFSEITLKSVNYYMGHKFCIVFQILDNSYMYLKNAKN